MDRNKQDETTSVKVYYMRFFNNLTRLVRNRDMFEGKVDFEKLERVKTLKEFDMHFSCRVYGFSTPGERSWYNGVVSVCFKPKKKKIKKK